MLTVIIAPEEYLNGYERNQLFTESLFREYDVALCKCYYDADNLQEMVPDLHDRIAGHEEWRAVIIAPDRRDSFNPFDYTGYSEPHASEVTHEFLASRRENRFQCYEKAAQNPLVMLSSALCGNVYSKMLLPEDTYNELIGGTETEYSVLLSRRLNGLNSKSEAYKLKNSKDDRLAGLVGEEHLEEVLLAIEERDYKRLCALLNDEQVLELNRILGGEDAQYTDPEIVDEEICNYKKHLVLSDMEKSFALLDKPPAEVRCVALRCFDTETFMNKVKHKSSAESVYSAFVKNNLYYPSMTFFAYDIIEREDKRYEIEFLMFLSSLLVFSCNEIPRGMVSGGYLYRLECEFSKEGVSEICQDYLNKLYATHAELGVRMKELANERMQEMDDFDAEKTFEAPVVVPVSIRRFRSKDDLKSNVEPGLTKNCPEDEEILWKTRFKSININFIKYLREPRRAVKTAVKGPFREDNTVVDDRIRSLTEYQREDIMFRLEEEERRMVETPTSHLFDTEAYNKKISEAGKKISDRIAKRMTKGKAIIITVISAVLYLIGFIPLFISSENDVISVSTSAMITSVCITLFLASSLLVLGIFWYLLKRLFRKFNETMFKICREIDNSLGVFSDYISRACNVMRAFSILNYDKNPQNDKIAIMSKHRLDIEKRIRLIADKYLQYVDFDKIDYTVNPYDFDFSKLIDYDYLPEVADIKSHRADFICKNNHIYLPVDYLHSIIAVKEDLYD